MKRYGIVAGLAFGLAVLTTGCAEREAYMEPRTPIAGEYGEYGEGFEGAEGYERTPYYREPGYRPHGPFMGEGEVGEFGEIGD